MASDYTQLTDDELNERVAKARGWRSYDYGEGEDLAWSCPKGVPCDMGCPRYTDDPVAWWPLVEEMRTQSPECGTWLGWHHEEKTWWLHRQHRDELFDRPKHVVASDSAGRAACIAWLTWNNGD